MDGGLNDAMNAHLSKVKVRELIAKIRDFRAKPIRTMSDHDIFSAIHDVLLVDNEFYLPVLRQVFPEGSQFFRARVLTGSMTPFRELINEGSFWSAPENLITKPGRLNAVRESLLYTTYGNMSVPLLEIKAEPNTYCAMMVYEAVADVKATVIGGDYGGVNIASENARAVLEIYANFLYDEFTRDVGLGTEYLYKTSEIIAKTFFDQPRTEQDAWQYPSLYDKSVVNICFRPAVARELLILKGTFICKVNENHTPNIAAVIRRSDEHGNPIYELKSEEAIKSISANIQRRD